MHSQKEISYWRARRRSIDLGDRGDLLAAFAAFAVRLRDHVNLEAEPVATVGRAPSPTGTGAWIRLVKGTGEA